MHRDNIIGALGDSKKESPSIVQKKNDVLHWCKKVAAAALKPLARFLPEILLKGDTDASFFGE
jgi:hypothetical protein